MNDKTPLVLSTLNSHYAYLSVSSTMRFDSITIILGKKTDYNGNPSRKYLYVLTKHMQKNSPIGWQKHFCLFKLFHIPSQGTCRNSSKKKKKCNICIQLKYVKLPFLYNWNTDNFLWINLNTSLDLNTKFFFFFFGQNVDNIENLFYFVLHFHFPSSSPSFFLFTTSFNSSRWRQEREGILSNHLVPQSGFGPNFKVQR